MAEEPISCPRCQVNMDKEAKADVIIDRCPKCGGIFLDGGELQKIQNRLNTAAGQSGKKKKSILSTLMEGLIGRGQSGAS